jgi:5-carboxymethyl-2-hydroxymuconate isomerase
MPHLTLEYSANLETQADLDLLCRDLHAAIMASDLFELGAVRVRGFAARHYAIADLDPRNAFLDMVFRIGQGRTPKQAQAVGELIFAAATRRLSDLLADTHFALSLEVREIESTLSWKNNVMHQRLRASERA